MGYIRTSKALVWDVAEIDIQQAIRLYKVLNIAIRLKQPTGRRSYEDELTAIHNTRRHN